MVTIHTDGASRGNPGPAAFGYVIEQPGQPAIEAKGCMPDTTNNVAEYTALVKALEHAQQLGADEVAVRTDSELMVKQIQGIYKVKNEKLKSLYQQVMALRADFATFDIQHVRRGSNTRADRLCNEALDAAGKKSPPPAPGTNKSAKKKPQRNDIRDIAVACLRDVAEVWAIGNPNNPKPEDVWDQLWSILEESGVLK